MWASLAPILALLALMAGALLVLRRCAAPPMSGRYLRVIDSTALGANKSLTLVRAAGRYFLLAVSANGIEKLVELDASEIRGEEVAPETAEGLPLKAWPTKLWRTKPWRQAFRGRRNTAAEGKGFRHGAGAP